MNLIFKYLSMHLKTKLEYKVSFILTLIGNAITVFLDVFIIYALFLKFGELKGYSIYEVMIAYGVVYLGFTIAETFGRGFDTFKKLIINGSLDLLLVRPRNIFIQIFGSDIAFEKISRALNALFIIVYGIVVGGYEIDVYKFIVLLFMIVGSIILFISIFIYGATMCFFTIQGIEVINILSDGTRQLGQYPLGIYPKYVIMFFTFVIPLACINYYPLLYLVGKSNNVLFSLMPFLTIIFFIPSILLFRWGMSKYESTGS